VTFSTTIAGMTVVERKKLDALIRFVHGRPILSQSSKTYLRFWITAETPFPALAKLFEDNGIVVAKVEGASNGHKPRL
jgi:DNA-directed RNA polymerase